MAYINAEIESIENAIRTGEKTIEQGQAEFAQLISQAETMIREDEEDIKVTEEGIKSFNSAIETKEKELESLSNAISDLRWEEIGAHRDDAKSAESLAQSAVAAFEKQRDEIKAQLQDLIKEKGHLEDIKHEEEQKLSNDQEMLNDFQRDKAEFDRNCEQVHKPNIARLKKQKQALWEK